MSTIAVPLRLETPALQERVGSVELAPGWGPPLWPAEPPTDGLDLPAVVQPSWMLLALAFSRDSM